MPSFVSCGPAVTAEEVLKVEVPVHVAAPLHFAAGTAPGPPTAALPCWAPTTPQPGCRVWPSEPSPRQPPGGALGLQEVAGVPWAATQARLSCGWKVAPKASGRRCLAQVSRSQAPRAGGLSPEGQLLLGDKVHPGHAKQGAREVTQREAVGGCHVGHFTLTVPWEWMEWAMCLDLASSSSWLGMASKLLQL